MLYSVQNFRNFSRIELSEIGTEIPGHPAQTLDVGIAADGTVVLDFAAVPAFQAGVDWEIQGQIWDVEGHCVVDDGLDRFGVLHDRAVQLHVSDTAAGWEAAEWCLGLQFLVDRYGLPDGNVVGIGDVLAVCNIEDLAKFVTEGFCIGFAE